MERTDGPAYWVYQLCEYGVLNVSSLFLLGWRADLESNSALGEMDVYGWYRIPIDAGAVLLHPERLRFFRE